MLDVPTYAPEQERTYTCKEVAPHDRLEYRSALVKIEDTAFEDDELHKKYDANFIRDIPDSMYYNPKNMVVLIENTVTKEVEGFSFLERWDDDTFYANITAVRHQGQGFGRDLIKKRDHLLKEDGAKYIVTHVAANKGYAAMLKEKYKSVPLRDRDSETAAPHQETLRLEL